MSDAPSPSARVAEFTFKAVACGVVFGILFGAANAYLGLKSGLTVATSIPIAVLSVAAFRMFPRGGTLLEANIAQTIGSASSSLSSGTIYTIPALFFWGMAPGVVQVALLAFCGAVLGLLAMIPLRRLLLVQGDAELPYPEGRACAEVLRATDKSSAGGGWIFIGLALGAAIKIALGQFHWLPEETAWKIGFMPNAVIALKVAPALLAVGFIIGYRTSSVMVGGALISSLVLVPLITKIYALGGSADIASLTAKTVRDRFVVFMGAGAVGAAGAFTVLRTAPTMARALAAVFRGLRSTQTAAGADRTDRDLPAWTIVVGVVGIGLMLALVPWIFAGDMPLVGRVVAALGAVTFALVFVPVASRLVGIIGQSSNPISGMALITLASTASIFLALGWKGPTAMAAVLTVGCVVCVAASKAGDISQDLKTGWLLGGTPALQQFGQLIAAAVGCWVIAAVVCAIGNSPDGFGDGAPQARLMKTVIEAVLGDALPWDLVLSGGALASVGILAGLPALPFALGIYLPLSTMATVFVGGCVRRIVERASPGEAKASELGAGILCASGYVAGEGMAGVVIAGWAYYTHAPRQSLPPATTIELFGGLALLIAAAAVLWHASRTRANATAR